MGANRKRGFLPIGYRKEMLTLLSYAPDVQYCGRPVRRIIVHCDCGKEVNITYSNFLYRAKSCGCSRYTHANETKEWHRAYLEEMVEQIRTTALDSRRRELFRELAFKDHMKYFEEYGDPHEMHIATRKYLHTDESKWAVDKEPEPETVGNFVFDDNVTKFE